MRRGAWLLAFLPALLAAAPAERWPVERAEAWVRSHPLPIGCNFLPSTASNQLEMWQAATWDPATIDRELGWAHELGFNAMRVFLHDQAWQADPEGFLRRVDEFLAIADRHHIQTLLVFFDGCWDPEPKSGPQRAPLPRVHNSAWVQSPGKARLADPAAHAELQRYVTAVLTRFRTDRRILGWDLFNEPENRNVRTIYESIETPRKAELALALLQETLAWARAVNPSQPLTVGVHSGNWDADKGLEPIVALSLGESDIISFHNYSKLPDLQARVAPLRKLGRPIWCTEYMARPNSTFETHLPYFIAEKIGAFNWGFVAGRSQTNYPWTSWTTKFEREPEPWFHDVIRADGKPFSAAEAEFLRRTLAPINRQP